MRVTSPVLRAAIFAQMFLHAESKEVRKRLSSRYISIKILLLLLVNLLTHLSTMGLF